MRIRTIDQRAVTQAKRRNHAVEQAMPLLAQAGIATQFMTTPDAQRDRLYRIETRNFWWFEEMKRTDRVLAAWAAHYRNIVVQTCNQDELAELDRRRAWMPKTPGYACDFWHRQAKERGLDDGGGVDSDFPPL